MRALFRQTHAEILAKARLLGQAHSQNQAQNPSASIQGPIKSQGQTQVHGQTQAKGLIPIRGQIQTRPEDPVPALPRLEARTLLCAVLNRSREWLIAHDTDFIEPAAAERFLQLVARRLAGEPMAYLLGWREFMGERFRVSPDTLIPRPETELLVETALAHDFSRMNADFSPGVPPFELPSTLAPRILDLGTGSGAIAVSIALGLPAAEVTATDISEGALAVASENARALGASVRFLQGDWYKALPPGEQFHLIVSNPPYIASEDVHLQQGDLRYEPRGALTDGADGLGAFRIIAAGVKQYLQPNGALWVEHGYDQAQAVRQILRESGLRNVQSRTDLARIERISGGYL
jgi:release factor glutamine methyltransferase